MRLLLVGLISGLFTLIGFATDTPKEKEKTQADKVVGKWRITKSSGTEVNGTTVEFTKDGKMTITMSEGDEKKVFKGTYKVTKEGIDYSVLIGEEKKAEVLTDYAWALITSAEFRFSH